ncbi:MAG: monovalent cation/H+ antiporter subunit D [Rubellimicrobium sp.]|nr:monovalent cation/H+ antiporter subunit D [Rubellimicrobium sp.]
MIPGADHLIIAPILIPFLAGALMLLYDERRRRMKLGVALVAAGLMLLAGIALLRRANGGGFAGGSDVGYYLLGNWAVPWGIVLVLDRLSALMVVLNGLLALPVLVYAGAGWHRQGQHFMSLMMFLFMGLNGAFLTGDLFSLFVFFEVLLAASYGLLLHGGGQFRVRAGLHYVAINLAGSVLFLIGVALIYGATGTLSMAHLSQLMVTLDGSHRPLVHAGAALMGLAFLVKAGIWPLSFWLPSAYMASPAPVAAMFAIMTKVGVYILLRLSFLVFGASAGASTGFGGVALAAGGMATMIYGTLGILGSQGLGRMAAHVVLVSSGTLLAVTGIALNAGDGVTMLSGALYYLVSSTLAAGMLFLLFEPMSRDEGGIAAMLALTADAWGLEPGETEEDADPAPGLQLNIPGLMTALSVAYAVAVLALAGLPPLSGFVGKFVILMGGIGDAATGGTVIWAFAAILIVAGFATLIGLMRIGIQTFWANDGEPPPVSVLEAGPVIALSAMLVLLTVQAEDVLRYTRATAETLEMPTLYVEGVLAAPPVAGSGEADP